MNKKTIAIIVGALILLALLNEISKKKSHNSGKDSSYYLTSPWFYERIDWFFVQLPEKWQENVEELKKGKEKYAEIGNDTRFYVMELSNFYLMATYMDAKDGIYQNWDLDKSANAMMNAALYNLKCKDISIQKNSLSDSPTEVNYTAISNCGTKKYKALLKGIRCNSHIFFVCLYYDEADQNNQKIAERIISSIENKYSNIENIK